MIFTLQKVQHQNFYTKYDTSLKKQQLAKQVRCFFFYLILLIKVGTKLPKTAIKKPIFRTLWRVEKYRLLQSANADQHRDRITRFATLKHRAKNQENYLFTLAKFKENYEKDVKNEESIKALKSAHKLNECGNYLLFKKKFLHNR